MATKARAGMIRETAELPQVARQGEADERVGDDEAVSGKGAKPSVHIEATRASPGKDGNGKDGRSSGDQDGDRGCGVVNVRVTQGTVCQAVVPHEQ